MVDSSSDGSCEGVWCGGTGPRGIVSEDKAAVASDPWSRWNW